MSGPRMPKGILLLTAVSYLTAICFVLIGSLFAVAPATLQSFGFRPDPDATAKLLGLGIFGGAGGLSGAIGYGLWMLKRWARTFVSVWALSTILRSVIGAMFGDSTPNAYVIAAAVVVLGYLWTPGVRAAFGVQPRSAGGP
jgi:hypothetical protein